MKSIRKEMTRDHLIPPLVAFILMTSSALANVDSSHRYNGLLQGYQQVNGLLVANNRRQTYFELHNKSHDEGALKQHYDECKLFDSQLRGLDDKMQNDRECRMMYRIMGRVAEYGQGVAEPYIRPDGDYYPSLMADLDEVDLEIEWCLNQLMSQYLEYLNTAPISHSRTLSLTNSILIVLFMIASLFDIVLNHQMSTSILNSIKRLTDTARKIVSNNLEAADVEEMPYAGLNQMPATFDQIERQIRTMITELHETHRMRERLAEAKTRELQTQVDLYFLLNTLNLIVHSAQLGERDTFIQLVKAIFRILRSSIKINTVSIPLDEETELLQSYLHVQKLYLRGRVTFCLDVRKSFMSEDVTMLPLTIQSLVESSIQHGLKDRVNGGKVDIPIIEKPDYIETVMADDGMGFPEGPNQPSLRGIPIPKTSIGLKSVEERLRLFYRKEDVLQIERTEGITKITLKLYKPDRYQEERVMLRVILTDDEQYEWDYPEKVVKESYPGLLEIVRRAVDGMGLLEKPEEHKSQTILLDTRMPRMDGLKTAKRMCKRYPDIRTVLISACNDLSSVKQVIKLGVTDYLLKPYSDSELRETLDKVTTRVKEWEDILSMLSYSNYLAEGEEAVSNFYRDLEKDLLWDVFFGRKDRGKLEREFTIWGVGVGWSRVVLISSSALTNMGGFFQEVLRNYFYMAGMTVLNSIWMGQMATHLYSQQQDAFTELTGYIARARDYLAEEGKTPVACGVSGAYESMERLTQAYGEAASFIREYSTQETHLASDNITKGVKRIRDLEEQIIRSLPREDQGQTSDFLTETIGGLETLLGYQGVSVKPSSGRNLMTIIRGINQIPGIRVKTSETARRFEKLGQPNFNGSNLRYHMNYFLEMRIQRR